MKSTWAIDRIKSRRARVVTNRAFAYSWRIRVWFEIRRASTWSSCFTRSLPNISMGLRTSTRRNNSISLTIETVIRLIFTAITILSTFISKAFLFICITNRLTVNFQIFNDSIKISITIPTWSTHIVLSSSYIRDFSIWGIM